MRIMLANSAFHVVGGSETYLLTVAEHLIRLGHDVRIFARTAGDMAEVAHRQGIAVVTRLADLGDPADVVVAQDGAVAYELAAAWPQVPQVFVCHSSLFDFQHPPLVPGFASAVVVLNDRVRRRVEALNADLRIVRLTQPIDTQRFQPQSAPSATPKRALILSNYLAADARRVLVEIWQEAGIEVVQVGSQAELSMAPEEGIATADIVIAKGRAALEAMACGRPTYVYDVFGGDGWITPERYAEIEADGISGNHSDRSTGAAQLRADLEQYDPELGRLGRELISRHHDARHHAHDLLDLLREVTPTERTATTLEAELGRQVRLRWVADAELFSTRARIRQVNDERTHFFNVNTILEQQNDELTRKLELSRQDADNLRGLRADLESTVSKLRDQSTTHRRRIQHLRSRLQAAEAAQQGPRWAVGARRVRKAT